MKKRLEFKINEKTVKSEYNYIPFRYIFAILITIFEVVAIVGIVMALCVFVPYFYVLCYITEIFCIINIVA